MSTLHEHFRKNVRSLLVDYNWTQQDLADAMGVTQGYVSQMLNGYRQPGLDVIENFAKALGVHALDLLGEKTLKN